MSRRATTAVHVGYGVLAALVLFGLSFLLNVLLLNAHFGLLGLMGISSQWQVAVGWTVFGVFPVIGFIVGFKISRSTRDRRVEQGSPPNGGGAAKDENNVTDDPPSVN